eukprot:8571620-Ditylum_brightwellii.AAC.2
MECLLQWLNVAKEGFLLCCAKERILCKLQRMVCSVVVLVFLDEEGTAKMVYIVCLLMFTWMFGLFLSKKCTKLTLDTAHILRLGVLRCNLQAILNLVL